VMTPDEAKMKAMGRMAGGIAHDLNNILGAIEGYATLVMKDLEDSDPIKPDIGEIRRAVAKAALLTKQLLVFSSRQALQKKRVSANTLIENLRETAKRVLGAGITLELDLQPGLPDIQADPALLDQLLGHLLTNARDALTSGGSVTMRTKALKLEPDAVRSPDPEAAGTDFVRISVSDTGSGMPPEVVEHTFEPFFTTKVKGKGIGLGLPSVYGIARLHNGWAEVRTTEGQGSEFSVFLPAGAGCTAPKPAPAAARLSAAPREAARILIVEDDEDLRNIAAKALTACGYCATKAAGAAEAVAVFKEAAGAFDVVFTDVVLGERNATEIVDEILKVNPGTHFIFTSGYMQTPATWDFINSRGYTFLHKPYSIENLTKTIEKLLDKRS